MREFFERAEKDHNVSYRDLRIILDALPTPLSWATLKDGEIRFTNRAFRSLFGYPDGTFPTVDDWIDRTYVRAEHRSQSRDRWQKLWNVDGDGNREIGVLEIEVLCADGSVRTVQHRGIILHEIGIGIATFEDVSDRKAAEAALHSLAFEDPLTGLANRRLLQARWSEQASLGALSGQVAVVLLIDLDGFKSINDRFGHDAGDTVLVTVADRLRESARKGDLICRLGGDEFVILLQDLMTLEQVDQLCWRIEAELKRPIAAHGSSMHVGASIGASIFPQDGRGLDELLKRADQALYRVKTAREGGWAWYKAPTAA